MSQKRVLNFTPVAYWYCCRVCKVCIKDRDQFIAHKIKNHSKRRLETQVSVKNSVSDDDSYDEGSTSITFNSIQQIKKSSSIRSESSGSSGDSVGSGTDRRGHDHDSRCECDGSESGCDEEISDDDASVVELSNSLSGISKKRKSTEVPVNIMDSKRLRRTNYESEAPEPSANLDPSIKKSYSCKHCTRKFSYLAYLYTHITAAHRSRNEFGVRTSSIFGCEFCSKVFFAAPNLRQHMWSHTKEKPFRCGICYKNYTFKQQLENHIKGVHTKEKPYQCIICKSSFTFKQCLNYHLKKRHP